MARTIARWWDPQPLPGGREAGAPGDEASWGQMAKGHGSQPGAKAPSLLLGEAIRAWAAVGPAGGWDVTGPTAVVVVGVSEGQGLLAKSLGGEPKALRGGGDTECGTHWLGAKASGNRPALRWAWREPQGCFKRRWLARGRPSGSSV